MRGRVVIITAGLLAGATFAWPWIWLRWGEMVTAWGSYSLVFEWLDQAMLLLWAFLFALGFALGFFVVVLARPSQPLTTGTASGLLLGLALILRGRHYFTADSTLSTYVWHYGLYLMAPLGSWIGSRIGVLVSRLLMRWAAV